MNEYFVYILTSHKNGALYVGVTNSLERRLMEHREVRFNSHTNRYKTLMLVYFEKTEDVNAALAREKQLKNWRRSWKVRLIESVNPNWHDLYRV